MRILEIRIAYTNPATATNRLSDLFGRMLGCGVLGIENLETGTYVSADDDGAVNRLVTEYERSRAAFAARFGPLTAAVSADDVFEKLEQERRRHP